MVINIFWCGHKYNKSLSVSPSVYTHTHTLKTDKTLTISIVELLLPLLLLLRTKITDLIVLNSCACVCARAQQRRKKITQGGSRLWRHIPETNLLWGHDFWRSWSSFHNVLWLKEKLTPYRRYVGFSTMPGRQNQRCAEVSPRWQCN